MPRPISGRVLSYAVSGALIAAALFVTGLTTSHRAEARVFIGFGFGFPGFVGPPIYAPPPPLIVYRPPVVYAPPPVVRPPAPVVYVPAASGQTLPPAGAPLSSLPVLRLVAGPEISAAFLRAGRWQPDRLSTPARCGRGLQDRHVAERIPGNDDQIGELTFFDRPAAGPRSAAAAFTRVGPEPASAPAATPRNSSRLGRPPGRAIGDRQLDGIRSRLTMIATETRSTTTGSRR